jgi:hypothetical protein
MYYLNSNRFLLGRCSVDSFSLRDIDVTIGIPTIGNAGSPQLIIPQPEHMG